MFKTKINSVTLCVILRSRTNQQNPLSEIQLRVSHQGRSRYFHTGKFITTAQWAKIETSRESDIALLRHEIQQKFRDLEQVIVELETKNRFSFEELESTCNRQRGDALEDLFLAKIEDLRAQNRTGTMISYQEVMKSIRRYMKGSPLVKDVTPQWLQQFEEAQLREGLSRTTIAIRMRSLRAILNEAVAHGIITRATYPFSKTGYQIREGRTEKKALTAEELKAVFDYQSEDKARNRYKDLWLFTYLANGINMADFVQLRYKNIDDGEIVYIREKTKRTARDITEIRVPISPTMQQILDRWGNPPTPENYLFPLIQHHEDSVRHHSEVKNLVHRINDHMNEIGKELGIGRITTYTARHTFATMLKRSGVGIEYISEQLGHTSILTTQVYLDSFQKSERLKNASLLTDFSSLKDK